MGFRGLAASAALATFGWVGAAGAVTILGGPPGNLQEKAFSTGSQMATTVTAITRADSVIQGLIIDISSAEDLTVNGMGFSQFDCASGGCSSFTIAPTNFDGFDNISFFLANPTTAMSGPFQVMVDFLGGGSETLTAMIDSSNKYEVEAGPGQIISSITVFGPDDGAFNWNDIKQIQFTAAVPEPAMWALMLIDFAGLGAALRSRRRLAAI